MMMDTYQIEAKATRQPSADLNYCAGKLMVEGGEVYQHVLKRDYHHKPLNTTEMVGELGDVLWYLANTCDLLGISLEYVAMQNITKLRERHGQQYNPAHYAGEVQP